MMTKIITLVAAVLVIYILYSGVRFYKLVQVSKGIIGQTVSFSKADSSAQLGTVGNNTQSDGTATAGKENQGITMLVLGDSSAVGVGASKPEESVAGRVSEYVHAAYVENRTISGALVRDLPGQIAKASRTHYSLILIQIGGNDIVRFHNAKQTADTLRTELGTLPQAEKVIVISAGDVGTAPLFPWPLHPFYHLLNIAYHAEFARALSTPIETVSGKNQNVSYVNLYTAPGNDLFTTDPETYFAADRFHPSGAGYGVWFGAVRMAL